MAWLTPDELYRLTRKKRFSAQRKVLEQSGIPFRVAPNGEPLVREDFDRLDGSGKPARNRKGLNWDALGA